MPICWSWADHLVSLRLSDVPMVHPYGTPRQPLLASDFRIVKIAPMPLFTFADRQAAESADSYVLLSDGRHHRLRAGLAHLPVASSVRMADLSHRLAEFEEPDGLRITPLSHALLVELAALFFEDAIPAAVLLEHHPEELIAFINIGMAEPEESRQPGRGKATMPWAPPSCGWRTGIRWTRSTSTPLGPLGC